MKAVVAAFNQEKALVGAFSVITNLRMELFEALVISIVTSAAVITWGCAQSAVEQIVFEELEQREVIDGEVLATRHDDGDTTATCTLLRTLGTGGGPDWSAVPDSRTSLGFCTV